MNRSFLSACSVMLGLACGPAGMGVAAPANSFFAMDTLARGGPDVVPALLDELGYAGLGGKALDAAMPAALAARGLRFFNGYHVMSIGASDDVSDETLSAWFAAVRDRDTALWLAIRSIARKDGTSFPNSAALADKIVVARLQRLARAAAPHGVRIALYPHTGFWLERVEDALRVADQVGDARVGVTFNLCHWLKVEGGERDPAPVLRAALPRLMFVTINGADAGDTRTYGWDRLIQPLDAGSYDVAAFLRMLHAIDYRGPVGLQGYGIKGDPRLLLERGMKAWRRFGDPGAP